MRKFTDYLKSYHKFSIECNMSAEKAADLLESELNSDNSAGFKGKRKGLCFRLTYVRILGRSSFRPDITIEIVHNGCNCCIINVKMDLFLPVKLFVVLWEVPIVLSSLFFILVALFGEITPFLFYCPMFAAIGYLLTVIVFNLDAVPAKNRLYTIFNIKESAKITTDLHIQ